MKRLGYLLSSLLGLPAQVEAPKEAASGATPACPPDADPDLWRLLHEDPAFFKKVRDAAGRAAGTAVQLL